MPDAPAPPATKREFHVIEHGLVPYDDALTLQRSLARDRIAGTLPHDVLLLVEHPPVITRGRSANADHLLANPRALAEDGIDVVDVERGGDITFHGPGQLVGYPILDLRRHRQDLHWYLRALERVLIRALGTSQIPAEARAGLTGVWTRGRKIASIGVHAKQWITWHGFALNVTTDLAQFDAIVPCGITGVEMTSVARELGWDAQRTRAEGPDLVRATTDAVVDAFAAEFSSIAVRPGPIAERAEGAQVSPPA
jgi:lipoyl(octanoyl) transferase